MAIIWNGHTAINGDAVKGLETRTIDGSKQYFVRLNNGNSIQLITDSAVKAVRQMLNLDKISAPSISVDGLKIRTACLN